MLQRDCVRVAVRLRPLLDIANEVNTEKIVYVNQNEKTIEIELDNHQATKNPEEDLNKKYNFTFDYVFHPECSQKEVYDIAASNIISSVLDGYNGTIFAYGQTGSGKTYTMYGPTNSNLATNGIIPRSITQIFEYIAKNGEIYPETVTNVESNPMSTPKTPKKSGHSNDITTPKKLNSPFVGPKTPKALNSNDLTPKSQQSNNNLTPKTPKTSSGQDTLTPKSPKPSTTEIGPQSMFEKKPRRSDGKFWFSIKASYMQLYMENLYDLLSDDMTGQKVLLRRDTTDDSFQMTNNTIVNITSIESMNQLLEQGNRNRMTRSTQMNQISSRAHTILSLWIETVGEVTKIGRLNLVDLAGSEGSAKAGTTGDALREGNSINSSLLTLGNCISRLTSKEYSDFISSQPDSKSKIALNNGSESTCSDDKFCLTSLMKFSMPNEPTKPKKSTFFIPYRDSKLTMLLKDSLGGNAQTLMIATVSPSSFNASETLNTLRYAQKAKMIRNKAVVNMDPKDALLIQLQKEVDELQERLSQQTLLENPCLGDAEQEQGLTMLESIEKKMKFEIEMIQCDIDRVKIENEEINQRIIEENEKIEHETKRKNEILKLIESNESEQDSNNEFSEKAKKFFESFEKKTNQLDKAKAKISEKREMLTDEFGTINNTWKQLSVVVKTRIPKDDLLAIYQNAEYDEETMQWRLKTKKRKVDQQ